MNTEHPLNYVWCPGLEVWRPPKEAETICTSPVGWEICNQEKEIQQLVENSVPDYQSLTYNTALNCRQISNEYRLKPIIKTPISVKRKLRVRFVDEDWSSKLSTTGPALWRRLGSMLFNNAKAVEEEQLMPRGDERGPPRQRPTKKTEVPLTETHHYPDCHFEEKLPLRWNSRSEEGGSLLPNEKHDCAYTIWGKVSVAPITPITEVNYDAWRWADDEFPAPERFTAEPFPEDPSVTPSSEEATEDSMLCNSSLSDPAELLAELGPGEEDGGLCTSTDCGAAKTAEQKIAGPTSTTQASQKVPVAGASTIAANGVAPQEQTSVARGGLLAAEDRKAVVQSDSPVHLKDVSTASRNRPLPSGELANDDGPVTKRLRLEPKQPSVLHVDAACGSTGEGLSGEQELKPE